MDVSVFEWVSGVVVPVMLGGATLAVALWAGGIAREANRLGRDQFEAQESQRMRLARGRFASAVSRWAMGEVAAMFAGTSEAERMKVWPERLEAVAEAGVELPVDVRRPMVHFADSVLRQAKDRPRTVPELGRIMGVIASTLDAWVEDAAVGERMAAEYSLDLGKGAP